LPYERDGTRGAEVDTIFELPLTHEGGESMADHNAGVDGMSHGHPKQKRVRRYVVRGGEASPKSSVLSGSEEEVLASRPKAAARPPRLTAARMATDGLGNLVEITTPSRTADDLILSTDSAYTLLGVANEFRKGDEIRRHGLRVRSKLLFCGPPGCGKTLCAEVVASELKMPLVVARLDAIIASHLGETATNLRQVFDIARRRSVVLFLDEFDALARARTDATEHNEIRRVVNSLLMMIDRFDGNSILIAATNLEQTIDRAIWRRFDEVVIFDRPTIPQIRKLLRIKTRNFNANFDISKYAEKCRGMSYAQVERACLSAIRASILAHRSKIEENFFRSAIDHEIRRSGVEKNILE